MIYLNPQKEQERQRLADDLAAYLKRGGSVPLVPIRINEAYKPSWVDENKAANRVSVITSPVSKRQDGIVLLKQGRSFRSVAKTLGVHHKTAGKWAREEGIGAT